MLFIDKYISLRTIKLILAIVIIIIKEKYSEVTMKLQTKVILPILLLIVALCGAGGYMAYRNAAKELHAALADNLRGEASALSRVAGTLAKSAHADVERITQRDDVRTFYSGGFSSREALQRFGEMLKELEHSYPAFDRVTLLNDKGIAVASSDPSSIGLSFADRDYFRNAMEGRTFLAPPVKSRVTGTGVMVAASPVKLNGKVVGAVYCPISLEYIYETFVKPVSVGKSGYAYILGSNGLVVAHKDKDVLFNPAAKDMAQYKAMAAKDDAGMMNFVNADGASILSYHAKDDFSGFTAVTQAEYGDVFSGLAVMRDNSILTAIAGIVLSASIIMLILRPVLRDVNAGMAFAGKVAKGDLSATLAVRRKDELGKLADALRAIPASLRQVVAEYQTLETNIASGQLSATGDHTRFFGEFAALIKGTNSILGHFRMIVDAIPSPVILLDKNLAIHYMNTIAVQLGGENYQGKSCAEVFKLEDHGGPSCALTGAVASNRPRSAETVAHPGGRNLDISYTVTPMLDDTGQLTSVLQLIIDLTQIKNVQRTIADVASQALGIADRVAATSAELASQVREVSQGADTQRDRVGSTATAMEEMNSTVMEVARNAGGASEQAEATRRQADEGAALVNKVTDAVRRVQDLAEELQGSMQELGKQAESIGGVMNVISDIADQTNLLALNAAIEAARAGDAGRGFAVVADEVRKLAEKTANATTEVGASIQGIQSATAANILRVTEASRSVSEATELAGVSGAALQKIVELAGANSALIAGIATAAEEQSATSEEINRAVEEINNIVTETASSMSQSAAAVQNLSNITLELRALLDKLKA